jgi:hypothetical protein
MYRCYPRNAGQGNAWPGCRPLQAGPSACGVGSIDPPPSSTAGQVRLAACLHQTHISAGNNIGEQAPPEVGFSAEVCWAEKACPVTRAFQADEAYLVEGSYPMNRACLVEGACPLQEACPEGASPVETACPVERASPTAEALTLVKLEEGPLTKRTGAPEAVIADSLPESAACRPVTETEPAAAPQAVSPALTEVLSSQQLEAAALRAASQLISALRYIVAEARRGQPLSLALMLKTHGILMEGLCSHPGQLRKTGCKAGDGFRYPPPKEVRLTIFDLFKKKADFSSCPIQVTL